MEAFRKTHLAALTCFLGDSEEWPGSSRSLVTSTTTIPTATTATRVRSLRLSLDAGGWTLGPGCVIRRARKGEGQGFQQWRPLALAVQDGAGRH